MKTNEDVIEEKDLEKNYLYNREHKNPYHQKLQDFSKFVYCDHTPENFRGKWHNDIFKNNLPINLEIGSGSGEFLVNFSLKNCNQNFIGIDYRFKRSFQLAKKLSSLPEEVSGKVKFLRANADRIDHMFNSNELANIFFFFPDPWPKKRHHKKRFFTENFLAKSFDLLKPGGRIFIKTDHDDYAEWMSAVIENSITSKNFFSLEFVSQDLWKDHPEHFLTSFKTKFEEIFLKKNINVKAFVLKSNKIK